MNLSLAEAQAVLVKFFKPGGHLHKYTHQYMCMYALAEHLEKFLNFMQA
jgi:hypothetical protein